MAQPQQAPVGGLNQARPAAPAAPAQPPKQENLAARASGMEQEQAPAPEDYLSKSLRELQAQREALNATAQRLKSSLDTRMGLPFDPTMMAAAAGFLKPTKTGSFGESLGYAAEGMSSEAEKQFARKQAANKMEMELQQKMYDLSQQGAILGHRATRLGAGMPGMPSGPAGGPVGGPVGGPAAGGAPAGGAPAGGAPARGPVAGPAGAAPTSPVMSTGAPRQQALITDKDIEEAYLLDPSGKYGKELAEIAKMQREDIISTPEGPYSRSRQQFLPQSGDKIVEVDFGRYIGTKKVPYSIYEEWKKTHERAVAEQNPNLEIDWFKRRGWLEGKPSTPAEGRPGEAPTEGKPGEKPTTGGDRPLTVEERKQRQDITTERGKAQVQQEKEQIGRLDTNFTASRELVNTARGMRELATSNKRAFDLMNDDGIAAAVMRSAQKGIQAGNFGSISIPSSELASYKLSKEDREALQMFAREYANLTVQFRKAARVPGEGATTEREGDLYAALGAMPTDTARVIRLKSEFIEMKGKYDQEVFKAWNRFSKNPENSYRDFLASDELDRINNAYDARLGQMQKSNAELFRTSPKGKEEKKPTAPAAPAAPAKSSAPAATPSAGPPRIKSREDAAFKNVPVGGLYVDVDGTVRTKKAGE